MRRCRHRCKSKVTERQRDTSKHLKVKTMFASHTCHTLLASASLLGFFLIGYTAAMKRSNTVGVSLQHWHLICLYHTVVDFDIREYFTTSEFITCISTFFSSDSGLTTMVKHKQVFLMRINSLNETGLFVS